MLSAPLCRWHGVVRLLTRTDQLSAAISRFRLAGIFVFSGLLAVGCATPPLQRPDLRRAVHDATGIDQAIDFRSDLPSAYSSTTQPSAHRLTMEDAVRRALTSSPDIRAAVARVRSTEADAEQVRLLPNPILSVAFRFPTSGQRPVIEAGLAADLIDVLKRPGRIEAADDQLRATAATALTTVIDVIAEVQERYVAVQSLDAFVPVLEDQKALVGHLLDVAKSRLQQGEGTSLDVMVLDSQRLDLEVEIAEKKLEREQEQLALNNVIGHPLATASYMIQPWQQPEAVITDEAVWIATALEHRPEIAEQRWELAALGVEVRLTRLSPFDGADIGIASERDDVWTLGPAASTPIPLFDWGSAKRSKAEALRAEAQQKLIKTQRTVIQNVRTAFAEYRAFGNALNLASAELLPLQQRRRTQTEAAYRAGQVDITALILADQDLQASKAKLVQLEQKVSLALIHLHRAVGGSGVAEAVHKEPATTRPASSTAPTTAP